MKESALQLLILARSSGSHRCGRAGAASSCVRCVNAERVAFLGGK